MFLLCSVFGPRSLSDQHCSRHTSITADIYLSLRTHMSSVDFPHRGRLSEMVFGIRSVSFTGLLYMAIAPFGEFKDGQLVGLRY